jgi:hypothetical protein
VEFATTYEGVLLSAAVSTTRHDPDRLLCCQLCSTAARSTGSAPTYRWMKASKPAASSGSGSAVQGCCRRRPGCSRSRRGSGRMCAQRRRRLAPRLAPRFPRRRLGRDFSDRDGSVDGGGQEALGHALCLEEAAVGEHPVQPYALALLVPALTFPVRGATELVATMPVPASPSGGHIATPALSRPVGSSSFAPAAVSWPHTSPACRIGGSRSASLTSNPASLASWSNWSSIRAS